MAQRLKTGSISTSAVKPLRRQADTATRIRNTHSSALHDAFLAFTPNSKSTAASLKGRATKVEEEIAEEVETKASVTNTAAGAGGSETESRAAGSPPSLIAKSSDPAVEAPAEADSEATDADTTDSKQADSTAPSRKIEPPVTTANEKNSADGGNVLVEEGGGREASSPGTAVKSEANPMSVGAAGVAAVTAAVVAASQEVAVSGAGDQKGNTNAGQANAGGDEEDSSDGDDVGDGFRIVVGREREAPAAPAAPTKRFLRGENPYAYCLQAVLY